MLRHALAKLSPAGRRARLSVLIFHRVTPRPDPLFPDEIDAARFDAILNWVGRWFNVMSLSDAVVALREGRLPPRAMSITFDDGYADNHDVALPLLRRHGMTATFFIATGFLDGGRMWNDTIVEAVRSTPRQQLDLRSLGLADLDLLPLDTLESRRAALPKLLAATKYLPLERRVAVVDQFARLAEVQCPQNLMMTSGQVRSLRRAGMQIGAHTCHHPILALIDRAQAMQEIAGSRSALEALIGEPVLLFAYPNGKPGRDLTEETVEIVRELGFAAAVTTAPGAADLATDVMQIPRFTPWDRTAWRFGIRLARNLL